LGLLYAVLRASGQESRGEAAIRGSEQVEVLSPSRDLGADDWSTANLGIIKMKSDDDQINSIRRKIPEEARGLFARVPVLASESRLYYWELVESHADCIGPRDVIEWLIVKNLIDLTWNMIFYRRVAAGIIDVARMDGLMSILRSILPDPSDKDVRALAKKSFTDPKTKSMITDMFIEHHINVYHINSEATRLRSQELERIDRMLASMESRYRQAYRDIDYHRESVRIRAEIESSSSLKALSFTSPSGSTDLARVPNPDEVIKDKERPEEGSLSDDKSVAE
jgi:hypothetical protein